MGSASREALAHVKSTLTAEPLGVEAGADLLTASAQIDGARALLAAFADASASVDEKKKLVERLFASASSGARSVLLAAVSEAWSNPEEFIAGVEELGLRAIANSNGALADELLATAGVIDGSHELELGLGSKLGDPAAKLALVDRLFSGKLSSSALGVVRHLVANARGRKLGAALRGAARLAADQGGSELATVTIAAPLSPAQEERVAALLTRTAGRPVRVTTVLDPALVGGIRIQIGDDVIDGSVRTRLDDLRLQLAG